MDTFQTTEWCCLASRGLTRKTHEPAALFWKTWTSLITIAKLDTAQYSRIENGKTDPSVGTLERIAKALGVSLAELFASPDELTEINSHDKTLMEKVSLIEALSDEER